MKIEVRSHRFKELDLGDMISWEGNLYFIRACYSDRYIVYGAFNIESDQSLFGVFNSIDKLNEAFKERVKTGPLRSAEVFSKNKYKLILEEI